MTSYVPVLKGKPGEIAAWRRASQQVINGCRVMFEVVPTHGLHRDLTDFVRAVAPSWPIGAVATIDLGYLDPDVVPVGDATDRSVMFLANALADLEVPIAYLPVVRLDDEPEVLAEVAAASEMHEQGACLRLGSDENDPDEELAEVQTPEVLAAIGLAAEDVDLVIDMWTVDSTRSVQRAVPVVVGMLEWAAESGPWRSVTVLSGAFPASISDLPTNAATPLRRYDAELFNAVVAEDPPLNPDFGDYAVNHPALPSSAARGPLPNLRYTHETNWQIYRQARAGEPGNEAFFTLCNRVVHSVHWPVVGAAYSWGDHEIQRCSNRLGGAGRATEWRAYGTSHHLVHVVDRLATLGSP